jgi:hypothetical protein
MRPEQVAKSHIDERAKHRDFRQLKFTYIVGAGQVTSFKCESYPEPGSCSLDVTVSEPMDAVQTTWFCSRELSADVCL